MKSRSIVLAAAVSICGFAAACDRPPSADDAKPWSPSDHDRQEEQTTGASQASPAQRANRGDGGGGGGPSAAEQLAQATWESTCFVCHGASGHGDGPNGRMVNAPDLTREEWQSQVKDEDIAAIITNGKNKMPKFDLSPSLVSALVARVRAMRGR